MSFQFVVAFTPPNELFNIYLSIHCLFRACSAWLKIPKAPFLQLPHLANLNISYNVPWLAMSVIISSVSTESAPRPQLEGHVHNTSQKRCLKDILTIFPNHLNWLRLLKMSSDSNLWAPQIQLSSYKGGTQFPFSACTVQLWSGFFFFFCYYLQIMITSECCNVTYLINYGFAFKPIAFFIAKDQ